MDHENDIERQIQDERAPLLPNDEPTARQKSDQIDKTPVYPASWYVWRALIVILALAVGAVFVKAWIESGKDIDVRCKPKL